MNLNEQLQQAYQAGKRQGLKEQMDMMPGTPYSAPMDRDGGPPIAPGTPPDDGNPPGGNPYQGPGLYDKFLRWLEVNPGGTWDDFINGRSPIRMTTEFRF